ncbi:MAG: ATP-dependent DNA helicase [Clostridia bacterium]|nr:ATP-dependent DNA helicase [Clostridia bacterium]
MFEITNKGMNEFHELKELGKIDHTCIYDFTFENRYLIYHYKINGAYQYVAFDKTTGLGSTVCKRKERLKKTQFHSMIGDILYSIKYTGDRRHIKNYTLAPEEFIEIVFRRIMPSYGYAVREEQIRMARTMYEGLTHKIATCCEAEVGTGKTLAYLVAGLAAKMFNQTYKHTGYPVTIATSSIELQKAIMENEIPMLSKMLMDYGIIKKPLNAVLRKGKEHYFCMARYNDYFKNLHNYPEHHKDLITALKKVCPEQHFFDLDTVKDFSPKVKARMSVQGNCTNCPQWIGCRYYQHLADASILYDIDFQITNHNMYLMNLMMGSKLLLPCNYCIIDEAHKLAETAAQVFGCEIESDAVDKFLNAVRYNENSKLVSRSNFKIALAEAAYSNHKLFDYLKIEAVESEDDGEMQKLNFRLTEKIQDLMAHLCSCLQRVQAFVEDEPKYKGLHCSTIISALERFKQPEKLLYWLTFDKNNNFLYLCCVPRNIEDRLFSLLWNDGNRSTVLTSGTMRDDTGFDYFKSENGLNRLETSKVLEANCSSPFKYGKQTRLYISENVPYPDNENAQYIKAVADEVEKLVRATGGHTAILFTSYHTLRSVYDILTTRNIPYPMIQMTRTNKNAIDEFKRSENGVLFASGTMWEGVNCVGDILSSVIIVKLPFPLRTELLEQKKKECNSLPEFVQKYAVPQMLIKLRQGAGRLIRSETDTGVIAILDSRAAKGNRHRNRVLKALSKYPLVKSIDELEAFIRTVKPDEYWQSDHNTTEGE